MKKKTKESLLWKIVAPNGGPVSYLFGTMHVRDLRAFGWLDLAKQHLGTCTVFATEFDFSETDSEALSVALELPEGKDLAEWLSPQAWKNLNRYARKKFGTTAESFRHQHPMTVSTALSMAFLLEESAHSLDETLWQYARSLGKPTTGVETFAQGKGIRTLAKLMKRFGRGRWRKRKGIAMVRLNSGSLRKAELHWYEAHGIGKRGFKIKRFL